MTIRGNACAWLLCSKTLTRPIVVSSAHKQFCCVEHFHLYREACNAVLPTSTPADTHYTVVYPFTGTRRPT